MRVLFLDRDGTIIREPADYRIDSPTKLDFLPYVIQSLAQLRAAGWTLVMVSNQDGLGQPDFPWAAFTPPHELMLRILAGEGVDFAHVYIDTHVAADNHPMRKPNPGMILDFVQRHPQVDLANSYVIGDRKTDAHLALNAGTRSLTIKDPGSVDGDLRIPEIPPAPTTVFQDWKTLSSIIIDN